MIAALAALLFFSPLAFIYGRYRARALKAEGGTLAAQLSALIPIPALFLVCAIIAIIYENEQQAGAMLDLRGETPPASALATGSAVTDFAIRLARWIGEAELILFMVAAPFIMGAVVAAVLLVLDRRGTIELAAPTPPEEMAPTQRELLAEIRRRENPSKDESDA